MELMFKVMALLPWIDWVAVVVFFCSWAGYAQFARQRSGSKRSVLGATNAVRRQWMLQATYREVRVFDGVVIQSLSSSPSFFASTTILIIGGLLAVLGGDKANDLVPDLPFAARTSTLIFDMKLILMLGIFVYTFFRFTWPEVQRIRRSLGPCLAHAPFQSVCHMSVNENEPFFAA